MAVIRLLLVTLLTTALLAISLPAIDATRETVASTTARDELAAIDRTITAVATNEPVPPDVPGAHRRITVTVPDPGPGSTGVAWLAIGGLPQGDRTDGENGDILAYRLPGGPTHVLTVDVDLRIVVDGQPCKDTTPLVLHGDTRLSVTFVTVGDGPLVRISPYVYDRDRDDASPCWTASRPSSRTNRPAPAPLPETRTSSRS